MPPVMPLLCAALLSSVAASTAVAADDFRISPTGGLYGGGYFTPEKNALYSGWTIVGRIGVQLAPVLDLEADFGWVQSDTSQFG